MEDEINITPQVEQALEDSGIREGLLLCNAMHITASVFINDDESGLHRDFETWLEKLAPEKPYDQYRHNGYEDNADAHLKRTIMGRVTHPSPISTYNIIRKAIGKGAFAMPRVHVRSKYKIKSFGGWGGFLGGKMGSKVGSRLGKLFGKRFGKKMAKKYLPGLFWKLAGALFPGLPVFKANKK